MDSKSRYDFSQPLKMLTMTNYPEWRRYVLDEALDYGHAGAGLQTGVLNPRIVPTFDHVNEDGDRSYPNTGIGNSVYLADKKAAEDYNKDLEYSSQRLLSRVIKSWDRTVKDRMLSDARYEALRNDRDLLGIWNLTQELIFTAANGVFTAANASEAFQALSQGENSFDSFVINLKRIVTAMDDFQAAIPPVLISSKLLNYMNCRGIPSIVSQHAVFSTTVPIPTIEVMIPIFQRLFGAELSKSKRVSTTSNIDRPRRTDQVQALVSIDLSNTDKRRAVNECTNCKKIGHFMKECPMKPVTCHFCKKQGHRDEYCRKKNKSRNDNNSNPNNNNNNNRNTTGGNRNNNRNNDAGGSRNNIHNFNNSINDVALYTNDNNVCFMCIEGVAETETIATAAISNVVSVNVNYTNTNVDSFWDTFGLTRESEHESDDFNEICFDNSRPCTINHNGQSWFDHYVEVLEGNPSTYEEPIADRSGNDNDDDAHTTAYTQHNEEVTVLISDEPTEMPFNIPIRSKRITKRKDDRVRKHNVTTRSMAKRQKQHTASVINRVQIERTWCDDTREFIQDLRSLLTATDQGISYRPLLSTNNKHYHIMHDLNSIISTSDDTHYDITLKLTSLLDDFYSESTTTYQTYMFTDTNYDIDNTHNTPISMDKSKYSVKLDTCSNATIMRNLSNVTDASIVTSDRFVSGIGGTRTPITHTGFIGNNIPTLVVPNACADILSISKCVDHDYHGTFNKYGLQLFDKENNLVLSSGRDSNGLFACSFDDIEHMTLLTLNFTKEQIRRAEEVRNLQQRLCFPSDFSLGTALTNGNILNCEYTAQDVKNASIIYGDCPASFAGKMTAPLTASSDTPPATSVGQKLALDLKHFHHPTIGGNTEAVVTVDENSTLLAVTFSKSKSNANISTAVGSIISLYNSYNHRVEHIVCDSENILLSIKDFCGKLGIKVTYTVPQQHNTRVEIQIRYLQDRERAVLAACKHEIPPPLYGELMSHIVMMRNFIPNNDTGNSSPTQLFTGIKPDLLSLAPVPWGTPVMSWVPFPSDKLSPRAEYGIVVGYHLNAKNAIRLYTLNSADKPIVVVRAKYKVIDDIPDSWLTMANLKRRLPISIFSKNISNTLNTHIQNDTNLNKSDPITIIQGGTFTENATIPLPELNGNYHDPDGDLDPFLDPFLDDIYNDLPYTNVSDLANIFDDDIITNDITYASIEIIKYYNTLNDYSYITLTTTVNDQVNPHTAAIMHELQSLIDMEVFELIKFSAIPACQHDTIMPSYILVKDKIKADGTFDKCKARCVIGGNFQTENMYGDINSNVINPISTNLLIKLATENDWDIEVYDIPIAYLHVPIVDEKVDLFMVFQPNISTILISMLIEKISHIHSFLHNGKLYVKLKKYLYGLKQSAKKFYDFICSWLISLGYTVSSTDVCLYIKHTGQDYSYIGTHVDDILMTANNSNDFTIIKTGIRNYFSGNPSIQTGNSLTHLGISIERDRLTKRTTLSEAYYIQKLIDSFDKNPITETIPYKPNILLSNKNSSPISQNKYLSLLMSIFFVARMTRWDILWVCTYMGSRSNNPTEFDYNQLLLILRYLKHTIYKKRSFHCNGLQLTFYVDASHGLHTDGKGHTGFEIRAGDDCIFCKSTKQRVNALSSTESEIIALAESLTFLDWILSLYRELHLIITLPITFFEDNLSTISIINNGPQFKRAKHMLVKVNFTKQFIDEGKVVLVHVSSEKMRADHLTKPVHKDIFHKLINDYFK